MDVRDASEIETGPPTTSPSDTADVDWLEDIIARLEEDPAEAEPAIRALAELDGDLLAEVLRMLAAFHHRPAVAQLLDRISTDIPPARALAVVEPAPEVAAVAVGRPASWPAIRAGGGLAATNRSSLRIVRSLVTPVDGEGRGTIAISSSVDGERRTSAFRCDVRRGILDAIGEIEEDSHSAGRLIEEWSRHAGGGEAVDAPELAVRLLVGAREISDPGMPPHARAWIEATIGPAGRDLVPREALPVPDGPSLPPDQRAGEADRVLEACSSWLDRSPLTFELAEELALREERPAPDPARDAGAYRYLFEHRLAGRLDLYARMLSWMAWLWQAAGRIELSRAAFALAGELSDEQHAVPSHPFTVALTTRSLRAAQAELGRARRPDPST